MGILEHLRIYHAMLAALVMLCFISGDWGVLHAWFGYGVVAVIAGRLVLALMGAKQLGLFRFYPHFEGLKLGNLLTHPFISRALLAGIALTLIGATSTGIAMDSGRALGWRGGAIIAEASADDGEEEVEHGQRGGRGEGNEALEELHEALANALMAIVGVHVAYLLAFKRPLALFMLFSGKPRG